MIHVYVDCSNVIKNNFDNGVSRVVKNIFVSLISKNESDNIDVLGVQIKNDKIYSFDSKNINKYNFRPFHRRYRNRFFKFFLRIFDQLSRKLEFLKIFGFKKNLFGMQKFNSSVLILPDATWSFRFSLSLGEFKRRGGRIIFYIHDVIPLNLIFSNQSVRDIKFQKWIDWGILNADVLVCVSNDSRNLLIKYVEIAHSKYIGIDKRLRVLHSGYEIGNYSDYSPIRSEIVSVTDTLKEHIFLVIGSADTRKNLDYIYRAFETLWNSGQKIKLIFGGPFSPKDRFIEDLKGSIFYNESLFVFSNLSDAELDYLYNKSSALVFASKAEGFGLPIVEAMTRGLPIICSDIPIFRELADGYAHFVDITKDDGLADSLIAFLKETPVEQRLSRSPRPWRSWDDYADELLAICQELVSGDTAVSPNKD